MEVIRQKSFFGFIILLLVLLIVSDFFHHSSKAAKTQKNDVNKKIIILSPHPDDATISCSSVIINAVKEKIPFKIVLMTNGDLFFPKKRKIIGDFDGNGSVNYLDYGLTRQKEEKCAVKTLGGSKDNLIFLGYPDYFLLYLYWRNFNDFYVHLDSPFIFEEVLRLNSTKFSLYKNNYHETRFPGEMALFSADYIIRDLQSIILDFSPTDIYVTHEMDTHPDHSATPLFLREALSALIKAGKVDEGQITVHRYIVHFNYSDKVRDSLEYPATKSDRLEALDVENGCKILDWNSTVMKMAPNMSNPLDDKMIEIKYAAINCMKSQTADIFFEDPCGEGKFNWLLSFVKSNEIWWDLPLDFPVSFKLYPEAGMKKQNNKLLQRNYKMH